MSLAQTHFAANRRRPLWLAAMIHRLSGIGLACFLPLHFLALGTAISGAGRLDAFLRWTDMPTVKLAEAVLMFLLFVHLLGGVRLLAVENLPWQDWQKWLATAAVGVAIVLTFFFLARVF